MDKCPYKRLNCGFYLGYLHDLKPELEKKTGLDLDFTLKSLCSFTCEQVFPVQNRPRSTTAISALPAICINLLSRGLPTFASLMVERSLIQLLSPQIHILENSTTGSISFSHEELDDQTEAEWLELLARAHCIIDPRCKPEAKLTDNPFDTTHERDFFYQFLPQVGEHVIQLAWPQREFASLIREDQRPDFYDARVDFAIETTGIKTVIEIDGELRDYARDAKRDTALRTNGWQVVRIRNRELENGQVRGKLEQLRARFVRDPYFVLAERNNCSPLWETDLGQKALQLVLTPFAVARLQKAILTDALGSSLLSLDQSAWNLVVVERDVPCAQLALLDLWKTLKALYTLLEIDTPLPRISLLVYTTPEFTQFKSAVSETDCADFEISTEWRVLGKHSDTFDGDLLIDISTLQRYGFTKPDQDFCRQHLRPNGVALSIRSVYIPEGKRLVQSTEPITYPMSDDKQEPLRFFLQNIFRKTDFREGQFEILKRSLARKPVIGLLPTGAGKSLCYQLSALLQPGVSLVIDPLRSLMFDQADNLKAMGIDNVQFINSEQMPEEREKITRLMEDGAFQIVFIAPERLQIQRFRDRLKAMTVKLSVPYMVIDEAHCVSEWGHDFRTSYLNLARIADQHCRFHNIPPTLLALTGTASIAVLIDVQRELGIDSEEAIIRPSTFDRPELQFDICIAPSGEKRATLLSILRNKLPDLLGAGPDALFQTGGVHTQSGIIFVPHVNGEFGAFDLHNWLKSTLNVPVEFYSGEVPTRKVGQYPNQTKVPIKDEREFEQYKRTTQEGFKRNDFALLVSTKAFGMGIDKPNIRYTIHHGIPQSLESFYQEAGRAGRDRTKAICTIIFSDDNADNANQFLDPSLSADELVMIPEPGWGQRGDIHRVMYFHKNAFQGIEAEKATIDELLRNFIYPALHTLNPGQPRLVQIPFRDSDKQKREKAIYRLSIVGVIKDYTVDYRAKRFEVWIQETDYLEQLQAYVGRFKTQEYTASVPQQVHQQNGRNLTEKCIGFLVKFVYDEIEKKRRAAIRNMAEVARTCHTDGDLRTAINKYFELSPFTEQLRELASRIEPQMWWNVLDRVEDVETAQQLLGGSRRTIESYTDHPGLFFLSGLAKLFLLPNQSEENALEDIRSGIRNLKRQVPESQQEEIVIQLVEQCRQRFGDVQTRKIAGTVLAELPTRLVARSVYPIAPIEAENVLLNLTLHDVRDFSQHFLRSSAHA